MSDDGARSGAALALRGIRKRLGGAEVLRGVDLEVARGRLVGLVGLNGAGKTTTLRVALGMLRADAGAVSVLGVEVDALRRVSGRVGAAMHGAGLEPGLTARQNLRTHALLHPAARRRDADADGLLERLGLARLADRRVGALSQGERRRVALARALLLEPDLVVLDEPLTHLDPGAVAQVLAVLRDRVAAGAAVLLSSHQLEHVERVADALVMLHRGRVVRAGETASLLAGTRAVQLLRATPPERARAAVERLEEVETVEPAGDDGLLRVVAARPCADRIGAALRDEGLAVSFLAPERRSLDELFHAEIRDADRAEAAS